MLRKTPSWWLVLLMYRGKFLRRNNLHLLSSVCLCGLFHGGVIYCSTVSSSLISHSSDWDVIFFSPLLMSGLGEMKVLCHHMGAWAAMAPHGCLLPCLFLKTQITVGLFWKGWWLQDFLEHFSSIFFLDAKLIHYFTVFLYISPLGYTCTHFQRGIVLFMPPSFH